MDQIVVSEGYYKRPLRFILKMILLTCFINTLPKLTIYIVYTIATKFIIFSGMFGH